MQHNEEVFKVFQDRDIAKAFIKDIIKEFGWTKEFCEENYSIAKLVLSHNIYYNYSKQEVLDMAFGDE